MSQSIEAAAKLPEAMNAELKTKLSETLRGMQQLEAACMHDMSRSQFSLFQNPNLRSATACICKLVSIRPQFPKP